MLQSLAMRILSTIGYEGKTLDEFIGELKQAGVEMVLDVRAVAASRRPGFSKTALSNALRENGIDLKEGEHALDLAVGDSGSLSPWLALACAYEHAVGYGGAQLIARYGDSHAVLGIVRPVIHASQSAGL